LEGVGKNQTLASSATGRNDPRVVKKGNQFFLDQTDPDNSSRDADLGKVTHN
jgi:hypothetical protein